jgi:(2Fe-2S) ferredoxin
VVYCVYRERFSIKRSGTGGTISKKKLSRKAKKNGRPDGDLAAALKPSAKVRDYDSHVLFCCGGDCKKRGAKDVKKALKEELRSEGINRDVRVDSVGCLGLCKHGPNAVVYGPNGHGGTWYLGLIPHDAPEIVEGHLKNGEPVEHLAAERRSVKKAKK